MLRIGYHVSIAGTMDLAFDRAKEVGCTAVQIFPSNPRGWDYKALTEEEVKDFRRKHGTYDITPVFVHMPYLPNLASPDKFKYKKSTYALHDAVQRCHVLGVRHLIMHLGSHMGAGKSVGIERLANAINGLGNSGVTILLENEAGQRNSVGSELKDLADLYDRVKVSRGFCFDTCHAFAAGYDVTKAEVLDKIDCELGMHKIDCVHMNDAKHGLGAHLDRHENIGFGHIGIEGFRTFFGHRSMKNKPVILETPRDGKIGARKELELAKGIISESSY